MLWSTYIPLAVPVCHDIKVCQSVEDKRDEIPLIHRSSGLLNFFPNPSIVYFCPDMNKSLKLVA